MTVATEGQRRLDYDQLVYAIGSTTSTTGVPGADEHAHSRCGPPSAARFASRLGKELDPGGVVVVGGNGLTGIEAATEIAESHPTCESSCSGLGRPGSMMGPEAAYLDQALARLGIEVRSGVLITKVLPDGVELDGGEIVRSDAALWTRASGRRLAGQAGLAVDAPGVASWSTPRCARCRTRPCSPSAMRQPSASRGARSTAPR